jgi:hypothetical protein
MWRGVLARGPRRAAALLQHGLVHPPLTACTATHAHAPLSSWRQQPRPAPSSSLNSSSSSGSSRRSVACGAAAEAQAQEDVPEPQARKRPRCSPLHFNVEQFSIDVVPTEDERKHKHQVRCRRPRG